MTEYSVTQVVGFGSKKLSKAVLWDAVKAGFSLKLLKEFLVLGIPGGVMQAANSCSFDVTTVMASILGELDIGACTCSVHAVLMSQPSWLAC